MENKCFACGSVDSCKYYTYKEEGEFKGRVLCNRHYLQIKNHGRLLDTENKSYEKRHKWTESELQILNDGYRDMLPLKQIADKIGVSESSLSSKANAVGLSQKYIKPNNAKYKAIYQDYDWCYDRYITKNMSHQQMADECGASLRVIQKWCVEIHKLHNRNFKGKKVLSKIQNELIMFSLLGDGHIDKRETQPLFIVSHAENQKDYLFWKYEILKDLCNQEPTYYEQKHSNFGSDKECMCKPYYRFNTKIIDGLKPIRSMTKLEIIELLNEFGLSVFLLDDGYRGGSNWQLCMASNSFDEKNKFISICKDRFGLSCHVCSDDRYLLFDSKSSYILDEIILRNIPNELDIIKYKITGNKEIKVLADYKYIIDGENEVGLSTYCKKHKINYEKIKDNFMKHKKYTVDEFNLLVNEVS